jgi:DNA-directed RNA polymerase specialized sigma54-like protein
MLVIIIGSESEYGATRAELLNSSCRFDVVDFRHSHIMMITSGLSSVASHTPSSPSPALPIFLTIGNSNSKIFIQMSTLRMGQTQSLQIRQELSQVLRMEQANLLEMPEDEFQRLIAEIERNPLFQRLYQKEKLIRRQRFPRTDVSSGFYELKEEIIANRGSLDVESLLLDKELLVSQIQKLGLERFKQYFLFPESGMTAEEIARECNMAVSEVQKINSLIDEFSIMSEFYNPSALSSKAIHYSKVATVEKDEEGFIIGYFSASSARGRYSVDYERFEELKASDTFTEAESKEARQLFKKLELINSRKDTLTQVLQNIIDKQALYLESGDLRTLLPFSQKKLAQKIGQAPSSVSRAIRGKSIDTPWGEEIPLKHFFPRPKRFRKELLRQLLETEEGPLSDGAIKAKLWEKFGVAISRRSVASLRKELKIPAAWKRKQALIQQRKL